MASPSDPEQRSFAETRRALLDALERFEQEAREREAEIVRRAEQRAREIVDAAEQRVATLDRDLAKLRDEIDTARAALAAIREQPPAPEPVEPARAEPEAGVPLQPPVPASMEPPEAQPAELPASEPSAVPGEPGPAAPPAPRWAEPQPAPAAEPAAASTSPQETLRALRAALEALNRPREGEESPR